MAGSTTSLCFVGVGSCVPEVGGQTACFLLNDDVLVDTGWNAALHMRQFGGDPCALRHVFITHCHHDHYMGLAGLIFYRAMRAAERGQEPLTIVGPRAEIENVVTRALHFLQTDRYNDVAEPVRVVGLRLGTDCETERFRVRSAQVIHPTLALAYRFEDKETGASVVITGDTSYYEPLGHFAAGADVLIHEASHGAKSVEPINPWGHCGAPDAARIAAAAGVKRLYLVHCPGPQRREALAAAREVFAETYLPEEGERLELPLQ